MTVRYSPLTTSHPDAALTHMLTTLFGEAPPPGDQADHRAAAERTLAEAEAVIEGVQHAPPGSFPRSATELQVLHALQKRYLAEVRPADLAPMVALGIGQTQLILKALAILGTVE